MVRRLALLASYASPCLSISFQLKARTYIHRSGRPFYSGRSSWHVDELYECFSYADLLDSSRIHSFQLHAPPTIHNQSLIA